MNMAIDKIKMILSVLFALILILYVIICGNFTDNITQNFSQILQIKAQNQFYNGSLSKLIKFFPRALKLVLWGLVIYIILRQKTHRS